MSIPSSPEQEYYGATARHYDPAYTADNKLKDVSFYVELAKSRQGTVLEAACGTGRILLPTARAGVTIDGFDLSREFIALLRAKLAQEPPEVRARVSLFEGDMRSFTSAKTYDLVTVPFRPLQHLYTVADQLAAFDRFHAHLKPGGLLAFNVFFPLYKRLEEIGEEQVELRWTDPADPSLRVERSFVRKSIDKLNQVFEGEFIFRSYRGAQLVREERSALRMSYYTYPHLRVLLHSTGFRVVEEYGSFDRRPISVCEEMILIAQKE